MDRDRIFSCELIDLERADINGLLKLYKYIKSKYGFILEPTECQEAFGTYLKSIIDASDENSLYLLKNNDKEIGLVEVLKGINWAGKEEQHIIVKTIIPKGDMENLHPFLGDFLEKIYSNKTQCIITFDGELSEFATSRGGRVEMNFNKYYLYKDNIDAALLNSWIEQGQRLNPDLRLEFSLGISEEYLSQYCDLFMETSEDMTDNGEPAFVPYVLTPDKQRANTERSGQYHWCYLLFDKDTLIAMSNVTVRGQYPRQFMIGVKKTYRGRGIGRWLYASMYSKILAEHNFKALHLEHHPLNSSAIRLSLETGYKPAYNQKKFSL